MVKVAILDLENHIRVGIAANYVHSGLKLFPHIERVCSIFGGYLLYLYDSLRTVQVQSVLQGRIPNNGVVQVLVIVLEMGQRL